ncbi:Rv1733c family protein [Kitasatospora sp. NPDC054795]
MEDSPADAQERWEADTMSTYPNRHNPVRRTSDHIQWWLARILLAVMVVGLPAAAAAAGLLTHRAQLQVRQVQSLARHTITAHLTARAPAPSNNDYSQVLATAAWTASDGTTHTATVRVRPGEQAGTPVPLWVDHQDAVTSAPITRSQAAAAAWTSAAMTATTVSLLCLATWKGSVRVLDHRRYAQWDAEWSQVEPRWSKRLSN